MHMARWPITEISHPLHRRMILCWKQGRRVAMDIIWIQEASWLLPGYKGKSTSLPLSAQHKYIHRSNMTFIKLLEIVSIAAIQRTSPLNEQILSYLWDSGLKGECIRKDAHKIWFSKRLLIASCIHLTETVF